jgi:hypothetical protein
MYGRQYRGNILNAVTMESQNRRNCLSFQDIGFKKAHHYLSKNSPFFQSRSLVKKLFS